MVHFSLRPRAESVQFRVRHDPDEDPFDEFNLTLDTKSGCWSGYTDRVHPGDLVSYRVTGVPGNESIDDMEFADPVSWAVVKRDDWQRRSYTILLPRDEYSRSNQNHVYVEPLKRIIYEAHVKDVSALDPNVPVHLRGTYPGAGFHDGGFGIAEHIKKLGCNTIEWLPLADYDHREPPYGERAGDHLNTWNRYAFNHWGYMPAYFFAPEGRYATGKEENGWIGRDGRQVAQTREMIHALHQQGVSVIQDVVYNHVAQYGENPIRQIDPLYSLRHDGQGNRISDSFCGNDLDTTRPVIRRMIVDSLKHWMNHYGVDGFRFDLAGIIDDGTLDAITQDLKADYEDVMLIAEPWGHRYDKTRYAIRGWASWNDHYRDALLGHDPANNRGALFGEKLEQVLTHLSGSLKQDGGPFATPEQSLNYLASHDGYTLGDFIRVALGYTEHKPEVRLHEVVLERIRLALMTLAVSRGPIMLQQGDEFGRCKCITLEETDETEDPYWGLIDRDSYNKDNSTNWIDWERFSEGAFHSILEYTRGLLAIRNAHPSILRTHREAVETLGTSSQKCKAFRYQAGRDTLVVVLNFAEEEAKVTLPAGRWMALADGRSANAATPVAGAFTRQAVTAGWSGMILIPANTKIEALP